MFRGLRTTRSIFPLSTSGNVLGKLEAGALVSRGDSKRLHRWVVDLLSDTIAEILVHSSEDGHYGTVSITKIIASWLLRTLTLPFFDDRALDVDEVDSDIVHEVSLLRVVEDLLPEGTRLLEVD